MKSSPRATAIRFDPAIRIWTDRVERQRNSFAFHDASSGTELHPIPPDLHPAERAENSVSIPAKLALFCFSIVALLTASIPLDDD